MAALILLTACDSDTKSVDRSLVPVENPGLEFPLPEKVRTSLAVDFDQVSGVAVVNGTAFELLPIAGQQFQALVSDVPINSSVSVELMFTERLPDGRPLPLAGTDPMIFSVGTTDQMIQIPETQYSYDFDADNDQISNIAERNDGTDPFVPENAGTRTITVQFDIPQRIDEPDLVQALVIVADVARSQTPRQGRSIQSSGLVPNVNNIDVDVRLSQFFQGQAVPIAVGNDQVEAGDNDFTLTLTENQFNFELDNDGDGVSNFDELQAGTNPFIAG